jgi:hypothetical protein
MRSSGTFWAGAPQNVPLIIVVDDYQKKYTTTRPRLIFLTTGSSQEPNESEKSSFVLLSFHIPE